MGLVKKKICLLGTFAVGKTSLTERFVHGRFEEKYLTTIGVKISQKIMPPVQAPGGGRMIHTHDGGGGIVEADLAGHWRRALVSARRP